MIFGKQFSEIEEKDLQKLVEDKITESWNLEYKQQMKISLSENEKKEFLSDITSLANHSGGLLIIGITERAGVPIELKGIELKNSDAFESTLNNLIRDCVVPRLSGVSIRSILLSTGNRVFLISVPKSWITPHMVTIRSHKWFYTRHSNGKHPMDYFELKNAFDIGGSLGQWVENFRIKRIETISSRKLPIKLIDDPTIVIHLVPFMSGNRRLSINPTQVLQYFSNSIGKADSSLDPRLGFHGVLANVQCQQPNRYVYIFRNGVIEGVLANEIFWSNEEKWIKSNYEKTIVRWGTAFLDLHKKLETAPPFYFMMSLIGFGEYRLMDTFVEEFRQYSYPIKENRMLCQEVIIPDYSVYLPHTLKPIFDSIWHECNVEGSVNYNDNGSWKHQ